MRTVLLCATLTAATVARGEVRQVLTPLKPGEIVAQGWLRGQLELSACGMGGHLGEIEPDQMEKPYITRDFNPANGARGKVGWCAEMGGEYALGAAMLAYTLGDPALIAKAAARVKAAMALQEPDGYLGAYRPGDNRQEDYNAWGCHWFYNTMLLEYYRTGDKAILDAVHRGLLWFVKNWAGDRKTDYAGPTIIGPAAVVYRMAGDKRLLQFCEEYAAWLDKPGHKNGATFTTFPLHRHAYHVAALAVRTKLPAVLATESGLYCRLRFGTTAKPTEVRWYDKDHDEATSAEDFIAEDGKTYYWALDYAYTDAASPSYGDLQALVWTPGPATWSFSTLKAGAPVTSVSASSEDATGRPVADVLAKGEPVELIQCVQPSIDLDGTEEAYTTKMSNKFRLLGGSLPKGLKIDANTGVLTGTPTTPGEYTALLQSYKQTATSTTKTVNGKKKTVTTYAYDYGTTVPITFTVLPAGTMIGSLYPLNVIAT